MAAHSSFIYRLQPSAPRGRLERGPAGRAPRCRNLLVQLKGLARFVGAAGTCVEICRSAMYANRCLFLVLLTHLESLQ